MPHNKKKINIMLFENSMYFLNKLIHKLQIHLGLLILYIPSCDLKEFETKQRRVLLGFILDEFVA